MIELFEISMGKSYGLVIFILILISARGIQSQNLLVIINDDFEYASIQEKGYVISQSADRDVIAETRNTAAFEGTLGLYLQSTPNVPGSFVLLELSFTIDLTEFNISTILFSFSVFNFQFSSLTGTIGLYLRADNVNYVLMYGNDNANLWYFDTSINQSIFFINSPFNNGTWSTYERNVEQDINLALEDFTNPGISSFPSLLVGLFIIQQGDTEMTNYFDSIQINGRRIDSISSVISSTPNQSSTSNTRPVSSKTTTQLTDLLFGDQFLPFPPIIVIPVLIMFGGAFIHFLKKTPNSMKKRKLSQNQIINLLNRFELVVYDLLISNEKKAKFKDIEIGINPPKIGKQLFTISSDGIRKYVKNAEFFKIQSLAQNDRIKLSLGFIQALGKPYASVSVRAQTGKRDYVLYVGNDPIDDDKLKLLIKKKYSVMDFINTLNLFIHIENNIRSIIKDYLGESIKDKVIERYLKDWKFHSIYLANNSSESITLKIKPGKQGKIVAFNSPNDVKLIKKYLEVKIPNNSSQGVSINFIEVGYKNSISAAELIRGNKKFKLNTDLPILEEGGFQAHWLNNLGSTLGSIIEDLVSKLLEEDSSD